MMEKQTEEEEEEEEEVGGCGRDRGKHIPVSV